MGKLKNVIHNPYIYNTEQGLPISKPKPAHVSASLAYLLFNRGAA